ncbi:LytTR family transcriptional regulator DNA-binding domain-containing protein [Paenibacillus sp. IB182496]|uniref:LytTR family transcriptional regulator DNA-binding domain-containing protein n=1 Tax=Paenibacillus sabuli TaxID=2772509 RepID=A0A927GRK3_9BACL|nr:LytTR family transcriptional regulator DNA-binding domain-containing protein [Paenibacillus sabuli]MBD2844772.1 LytTR family transcriptional regulator DNA-binding domain-containing protein [Paenibacillus sabuli]
MGVALETKNVYEFEVKTDILFFKVGAHHQVSFHGRHYHIKKRMSAEQLGKLIEESGFVKVKSDCYVNVAKVAEIGDDHLYFGSKRDDCKSIPLSRRKQQLVRSMMPG